MFDRQSFFSALFYLVAILSLLALLGCSSLPEGETTSAPAPAAIPAPAVVISVPAHEMPAPELAAPPYAAAPVMIQEPAPPVHDPGTISDAAVTEPVDLPAPPNDLWERIRRGFAMPNLDSPLVEDRENWYAGRVAYFERMVERSKLYMYHIVDELEKRGMPTELALLPMVESAFNPMAYSRAHASGLWQFIPSTAKHYKLEQNWWYDARRDIVASTSAALDYLEFLFEMHGDWQLALASYNWGENAVARAVKKNVDQGLPADYANLRMPQETRYYVPKLQALKNIIANPDAFGIDLDHIPNEPYFSILPIGSIDIRLAAELAQILVEDLIALNPAHKRPVISAAQSRTLVLPVDRVAIFQANLAKRSKPWVSWKTQRLGRGETLTRLAAKHRISLTELKRVNGIVRGTRLRPGTEILLPVNYAEADADFVRSVYRPSPSVLKRTNTVHIVRRGDTLYRIADHYDVSVADLRRWNSLGRLKPGRRLVIRLPTAASRN